MSNRILSVMFTDIQGYTARTSAQSRDATLQLLKRHRDLLLPVLARYGGRLVKGIGDAFLVTFDSPTDAVLAGIAVQETLAAHNAGVPDAQQLRIRVAIHTGEVLLAEDDVYGEAVNIAARIEGIAEPGEVYFTEATYLSMNRAEVPSAEIGYRILKGIPEKIKVFKVLRDGQTVASVADAVAAAVDSVPAEGPAAAPRGRRVAAFALDLLLVALLARLLLVPLFAQLEQQRGALAERRGALAGQLLDGWKASAAQALAGRGEVDPALPEAAGIRAFRDEVSAFIRARGLQQRSREAVLGALESDPRMRARMETLRRQLASAAQARVELWLGDPATPLPARAELPAGVGEYRQQAARLAARQQRARLGLPLLALGLLVVYAGVAVGWRGRTAGKALLRLRVTDAGGGHPGFARALGRALGYLLSALPLGLGFAWGLAAADRRAWHDRLSGTRVVAG